MFAEKLEEAVDEEEEEAPVEEVEQEVAVESLLDLDAASITPPISLEPEAAVEKSQIRFAEDILVLGSTKPGAKTKKKKKGASVKERAEDGIKLKKGRRAVEMPVEDEY